MNWNVEVKDKFTWPTNMSIFCHQNFPHLEDSGPLVAWPKREHAQFLLHEQPAKSDHFSALGNHFVFQNQPFLQLKTYSAHGKNIGFPRSLEKYNASLLNGGVLGTIFSRKGSWDSLDRRHLAGYYYRMLGLISRQAPRLLRQPGSLIFRRCLADGAPAVALTFGSPTEVS